MERTTRYTFSQDERIALKLLKEQSRRIQTARIRRDDLIRYAVGLGLPVRVVGEAAQLSGAQVSRLTGDSDTVPHV